MRGRQLPSAVEHVAGLQRRGNRTRERLSSRDGDEVESGRHAGQDRVDPGIRGASGKIQPSPSYPVVRPEDAHGFRDFRSEEHTSEIQSLKRISDASFCLKKKNKT